MAILEKIEELPAKQRAIIVGVVLVLMIGAYYQMVYTKKTTRINIQQSNLATLNSELQDLRAIQKKLAEFKSMIKDLEAQLNEAQRQLPKQREIPTLLNDISKFGKESGLEFITFRPQKERKKGFYAEVPVSLVFNGPFHNIAAFIDKIVHYPRIIKITSLTMGGPREVDGHVMLKASATATTYRYIEESEKKSGKKK
jgi:type IV pilus assembly protein PilO